MAVDAGFWPSERSEMGRQIRRRDWSATVLGAIEHWPTTLCVLLDTVLDAPLPMCILWGEAGLQLYNDAHAAAIGKHHPGALGMPLQHTAREAWPAMLEAYQKLVRDEACLLRHQYLPGPGQHEAGQWFDLSISPIRNGSGVAGQLL